MNDNLKAAWRFSVVIAILAALVSFAGLFWANLYRDPAFFRNAFRGNDLVTLAIAVPLLLWSLRAARRGAARAMLVWMAMLVYMLYNYAYYVFGAVFNPLFLIYVALFSLPLFALIFSLPRLDVAALTRHFGPATPARPIAGFIIFLAIVLGGVELGQVFSALLSGRAPQSPTLIYALDLSWVMPFMVLGAVWLWQRRPWGYVLGAILMIKSTAYGLALLAMAAFVAGFSLSGAWDPLTPFYALVAVGSLVSTLFLLKNGAN